MSPRRTQDNEGGASKLPCPDAAGAGSHRPASGARSGFGSGERCRSVFEIPFPPAVHVDLRVVRASLCPARPHEACFVPAGLQGCPKRHGYSDGCWLRRTGCLRPRLSATVRTIAFVVSEISRLGAVACGLRASRQRKEQAHADDFYPRRRDYPRCIPDAGGDYGASGRPGDHRCHHPAVHCLAEGHRPGPEDKPHLQRLPF